LKEKQRSLGPKAIHEDKVETYGKDAYSTVKNQAGEFTRGTSSIQDDSRRGRPATAMNHE